MDLRLLLTAFATGVCLVLFALIAAITFFDSEPTRTSGITVPVPALAMTPTPDQSVQIEASQAPVSGQQVQSQEATTTPEPAPTDTLAPVPTPTLEPLTQPAIVAGNPAPPGGLTAAYTAGQGVTLSWNPVTGAAYYNVYRSQLAGGGPGATYVALGSSGATAFLDSAAAPGQIYYYVVTASSGGTESSSSNEASVQVP